MFPWWLLLPQGVSGAIKKKAGLAPFRELAKVGTIPLGGAVLTGPGRLNYRGIIHVAGINLFWRASERSIRSSVTSAMKIVEDQRFTSVAFPIICAGSGGFNEERALDLMMSAFNSLDGIARVVVVRYQRTQ